VARSWEDRALEMKSAIGLLRALFQYWSKAVAQLLGHRPDAEHVDIGEVQVGLGIEILIPQVAPADDRHAVVRQPQLVVHAPVLQRQVEQPAHGPCHAGAAPQVQAG
jgi:hypothetical protein